MTEIFYEMEILKFTFMRFFVSSTVRKVLNVSFGVAVNSVIDLNFCTKGTWKNSKGKCNASRLGLSFYQKFTGKSVKMFYRFTGKKVSVNFGKSTGKNILQSYLVMIYKKRK
jgi:hypothetical protein